MKNSQNLERNLKNQWNQPELLALAAVLCITFKMEKNKTKQRGSDRFNVYSLLFVWKLCASPLTKWEVTSTEHKLRACNAISLSALSFQTSLCWNYKNCLCLSNTAFNLGAQFSRCFHNFEVFHIPISGSIISPAFWFAALTFPTTASLLASLCMVWLLAVAIFSFLLSVGECLDLVFCGEFNLLLCWPCWFRFLLCSLIALCWVLQLQEFVVSPPESSLVISNHELSFVLTFLFDCSSVLPLLCLWVLDEDSISNRHPGSLCWFPELMHLAEVAVDFISPSLDGGFVFWLVGMDAFW